MRHGLDGYRGFGVGSGARWCLLHVEREAALDGWVAVRLRDIRHVRASRSFIARAIELAGESPAELSGIDLDADADVVTSAAEHIGLIGLAGRHGELRIGRLERASRLSIVLREVDTRGLWVRRPTRFKLNDIAAVVIGGRYLDRLAETLAASPQIVPEYDELDEEVAVEDTASADHGAPVEAGAPADEPPDARAGRGRTGRARTGRVRTGRLRSRDGVPAAARA